MAVTARIRRIVVLLLACVAVGLCPPLPAAWAEGVAVDKATSAHKREAQKAFEQAMADFEAKRLDDALAGFWSSYYIVASPNTRLMIVHVLGDLGRPVDAYAEALKTVEVAERAAARSDRYAAAADSARKALARYRAAVGLVTVTVVPPEDAEVPEGATLSVAGNDIDRAEWGDPVVVAPGQCEVVLVTESGTAKKEIAVSGGAAIDIDIALAAGEAGDGDAPDPDGTRPDTSDDGGAGLRVAAYIFGGLGVAGAVVFAAVGSKAQSNYDELVDQCPNDRCPADLQSQADDTRTQQTAANIGLIVGAVGLATGLGLLIASFAVDGSDDAAEGEVGLTVGPGSLSIMGSF